MGQIEFILGLRLRLFRDYGCGGVVKKVTRLDTKTPKGQKRRKLRDIILGIDPGLSGAIAMLDVDTLDIVDIVDVPTYQTQTKSRKSGKLYHVDIHSLSSILSNYQERISVAIIESPGSMPGQGLSSTFRFGKVCGQMEGILAGLKIPHYPVVPAAWKFALGVTSSKDDVLDLVRGMYPDQSAIFRLKKHHDRAEAVLLARFGVKYVKDFVDMCR